MAHRTRLFKFKFRCSILPTILPISLSKHFHEHKAKMTYYRKNGVQNSELHILSIPFTGIFIYTINILQIKLVPFSRKWSKSNPEGDSQEVPIHIFNYNSSSVDSKTSYDHDTCTFASRTARVHQMNLTYLLNLYWCLKAFQTTENTSQIRQHKANLHLKGNSLYDSAISTSSFPKKLWK